jgi:hypothetical protein
VFLVDERLGLLLVLERDSRVNECCVKKEEGRRAAEEKDRRASVKIKMGQCPLPLNLALLVRVDISQGKGRQPRGDGRGEDVN